MSRIVSPIPALADRPASARPAPTSRLQSPAVGNQARLRRLQPKLEIGAVDDPLEREADEVADKVMRMPDPALSLSPAPAQVSRKCAACEEEDKKKLQMKPVNAPMRGAAPVKLQRKCAACEEEDKKLQRKADGGPTGAHAEAPPIVHEALSKSGRPLDAASRAFFEPRLGRALGEVRIHTDGAAADSARSVAANAYAVGRDVVFAEGRYAPESSAGRRLIAHELAHVIQQGAAPDAQALGFHSAPAPFLARDAAEDEIKAIEAAKLEIGPLLERCEKLDPALRDQMIAKVGSLAKSINEERQLACLLAAKFKGTMKRADFYNTYHGLLERMPVDQSGAVLDYVGTVVIGKTMYNGELIDKQSINLGGMSGAPGSSIVVNEKTYVVLDDCVQFQTNKGYGPARQNNNPGNITVDDKFPDAWSPEIGAYRGRNTDKRFAIFPTYEKGRAGAIAWAKNVVERSPEIQLLQYFKNYAPEAENPTVNNAGRYADDVAKEVSTVIGKTADRTTKVKDIIDANAMEAFVKGQEIAEGFSADSTVDCLPKDSPALPQEVRDFTAAFDKKTGGTEGVANQVVKAAKEELP